MKFLDANGLALFTKRIFSKFVSNITGADNKITITKGDGTTNEINLNEVVKTDVIGEDPPDDDNSNKIPSTRWVQKFVATMVFKLISKLAGTEETGVSGSGSFLGVNWLIAQNGYICFGKLFGGLILQWGFYWYAANNGEEAIEVTLPVSFSQKSFISQLTNYDYTILGETHGLVISSDVGTNDLNKFKFYDLAPKGTNNSNGIFYFIIGK